MFARASLLAFVLFAVSAVASPVRRQAMDDNDCCKELVYTMTTTVCTDMMPTPTPTHSPAYWTPAPTPCDDDMPPPPMPTPYDNGMPPASEPPCDEEPMPEPPCDDELMPEPPCDDGLMPEPPCDEELMPEPPCDNCDEEPPCDEPVPEPPCDDCDDTPEPPCDDTPEPPCDDEPVPEPPCDNEEPVDTGSCNSGSVMCCESVQSANTINWSQMSGEIASLIPALLQSSTTPMGLTCSPLAGGASGQCNQQTVCCDNVTDNSAIGINCNSFNAGLIGSVTGAAA